MSEVWNLWELKPPPICLVRTELQISKINNLKVTINGALKTLENLKVLDREAATLSRFMYKSKRVFRHDKGIRTLSKVNQCLKRYLKLDLKRVLSDFQQSLPSDVSKSESKVYLPTKQMLKWVLLRLQAFCQIFSRILNLTKETGVFIYQKLFLGWSLKQTLMAFCLTARIMVLSKFLILKSIDWYNSLYKFLQFFRETVPFVPDHKFPEDLKPLLETTDLAPLKKKTLIDSIFELVDLTVEDDDDEIKILDEKLVKFFKKNIRDDSDIEEIIVEETTEEAKATKRSSQAFTNEDVGVPIVDDEVIYVPPMKKRNFGEEKFKGLKKKRKSKGI